MSARFAALALAVLLSASPARADIPETVRLEPPTCAHLPFQPERLRELLALELAVSGSQLVDGEALATVRYDADPCEPGASAFVVSVDQTGEPSRAARVSLAQVPLGTLPRALALDIAESLRGGTIGEATSAAISPTVEPPVVAEAAVPAPVPVPETQPETELPVTPPRPGAAFFRLLAGASFLNTPDTGGVASGIMVGLDIPLADLPLSLRIDASMLLGHSDPLTIAVGGGGLSAFIWADALPELVLRFGPRVAFGHGAAIDAEASGVNRTSEDLQMTIGVVVGADVKLAPGLDLLLGAEVGTTVHGVRYTLPDTTQAGIDGAYWGVTVLLGVY